MRPLIKALAMVLAFASICLGQGVEGVRQAKPGQLIVISPTNIEGSRTVWQLNYPERFDQFQEENGKLFIAMPRETISFTLLIVPNDITKPLTKIRHTIDVDGKPTPEPEPEPDDPPDPEPIEPDEPDQPEKLTNLKVLFVVEFGAISELPESKAGVLFSPKVRNHVKQIGGEFRMLDPDAVFTNPADPFQTLLKRPRDSIPWMIIAGDEGVGFEGPMPPNVEAALRFMDSFKGIKPKESAKPVSVKSTKVEAKSTTVDSLPLLVPVHRVVNYSPVRRVSRQLRRVQVGTRCEFDRFGNRVCKPHFELRMVEVIQ